MLVVAEHALDFRIDRVEVEALDPEHPITDLPWGSRVARLE
jgi:hypothetical protein